jgi:hypothetical protein
MMTCEDGCVLFSSMHSERERSCLTRSTDQRVVVVFRLQVPKPSGTIATTSPEATGRSYRDLSLHTTIERLTMLALLVNFPQAASPSSHDYPCILPSVNPCAIMCHNGTGPA